MLRNVSSAPIWDLAIAQCCQEPVHIPGHIQSFGGLLATDEGLEKITHKSANLDFLLGITKTSAAGNSLLGQDLQAVLPEHIVHKLRGACGLPWIQTQRERIGIHTIKEQSFDISVHCNGDRTLIELEPSHTGWERPSSLVSRMKSLMQSVRNSDVLLRAVAEELRDATGFDRVLAYRFLSDGSGEVLAEARSTDMDSLLGLRFPATDIPELARSLFLKNPLRVIPDINSTPVPLLACDPDEAPLDLSLAQVRSASIGHTQRYLAHMDVQGSMTIAIIVEERLWGLFALHHTQPRLLSPDSRAAVEICGTLFSLYLQQTIAAEHFHTRKRTATVLAQTFAHTGSVIATADHRGQVLNQSWEAIAVKAQPQLCKLLEADGIAFVANHKVLAAYGQTPPESSVLAFVNHPPLQQQAQSKPGIVAVESFASLALSATPVDPAVLPSPLDWGNSAGGGFFSIKCHQNHYFAFFRNELISEVKWAGNPHQQYVVPTDTDFSFSPARSFEMYQETVRGQCRPWSRNDIAIVLEIKAELQNQIGLFMQQQQDLLIAELKHRVKNILAMIRSVARQTGRSRKSITEYIHLLDQRLEALGMAHELLSHTGTEWPSLRELLSIELRPYLSDGSESGLQVQLTGSEAKLNSHFIPTFILVIHEIVSNAVKYGALSVPEGKVTVNWQPAKEGLSFLWKESNGPQVQPPQERGFGCDLIERAIPYEFAGEAALHFLSDGVEIDFWLPGNLLEWVPLPAHSQRKAERQPMKTIAVPSSKGSALIVEDNMLIAIELENTLKALGFEPVDSAPSLKLALKLLTQKQHRICLLDIDLKTETTFSLAYDLQKQQIPFVFTTGYDSKHPIPGDLKSVTLLKKPLNLKKLQDTLDHLLTSLN